MTLLGRLDAYGTADPDFNEPQYEDRCPLCDEAVVNHYDHAVCACRHLVSEHFGGGVDECGACGRCDRFTPRRGGRARWKHRRAALAAILRLP